MKKEKEVIVVQNKEGCFLQTLNFGCAVILVIIMIIVALTILGSLL